MRYRLRAEIVGKLLADASCQLRAECDGVLYELHCAPDTRKISHVSVSMRMSPEELADMRNLHTPSTEGRPAGLYIGGNEALTERLEHELRTFEAALSFGSTGHAVEAVNVWECEFEYIPESEEERKMVAVTSFQVTEHELPLTPVQLGGNFLPSFIDSRHKYGDMVVPLGFFREGRNSLRRHGYIQAFHQFYFVIEGLFAEGKTGEKEVLKAFASSEVLSKVTTTTMEQFPTKAPKHWKWATDRLADEGLEQTVGGLHRMLFRLRGDLRHFFLRSRRKTITPFNDREFHSPALLLMYMGTLALGYRMAEADQSTQRDC